jgi:ribosomal 30S subunit maturation factor RimM
VVDAPSCSVLELDDGTLVPFVSDAVERVDTEAREIHVRQEFLS